MKKFIKGILLFSIPLLLFSLLIVGTFYLLDPFKVVKHYDEFYNSIIAYNEDYVNTERYLRNEKAYNSFVFGSSRAGCGFKTEYWAKHLKKTDSPYCFAASNESIFGIAGKIRLIDQEKAPLDNVLLIIDADVTFNKYINSTGHLYIKHPRVSNESEEAFITEYLKDYVFTGFFIAYLDYKMFKTDRDYIDGFFNTKNKIYPNEIYTPFNVKDKDELLKTDKNRFYEERKNIFYKRDTVQKMADRKITSQGMEFLHEIKNIFEKHNTNYKIIISPLYDQVKINNRDLDVLIQLYGKENVFDFSGINKYTDYYTNYYETMHYLPSVGNEIMEMIYKDKLTSGGN